MSTQPLRALPVRNRRYRQFLTASTISLIGSNVFDISMPLYMLHRTGSVIDLSLVTMALHLPHFLMAPLTGYFSDHSRKRQSLILADLGQIFFLLLLSGYVLWGGGPIWPILALVFLVKSLMLTFETISQFQLIPALVGPGDLNSGNKWFLSLHRVIQIVGPLMGGVLMHYVGVQSCIWVNVLSFAATLRFAMLFRNLDQLLAAERLTQPTELSATAVADRFRESLHFIWRSPIFHPFILLMFLWNLSSLTLNSPTLTYFFTITHQYTAAEYGLVISSFGVIGIFGFLFGDRLYRNRSFPNVFLASALFQAVFGTLCILPLGMPVLVGALYGMSRAGSSVLSMGSYFIRQTRVPRNQNGAINASLRMFFMAAAPVSSLLQGWIIQHLGVGVALFLGAVCLWGTWFYSRALARAWEEEEKLLSPYPHLPRRSA